MREFNLKLIREMEKMDNEIDAVMRENEQLKGGGGGGGGAVKGVRSSMRSRKSEGRVDRENAEEII